MLPFPSLILGLISALCRAEVAFHQEHNVYTITCEDSIDNCTLFVNKPSTDGCKPDDHGDFCFHHSEHLVFGMNGSREKLLKVDFPIRTIDCDDKPDLTSDNINKDNFHLFPLLAIQDLRVWSGFMPDDIEEIVQRVSLSGNVIGLVWSYPMIPTNDVTIAPLLRLLKENLTLSDLKLEIENFEFSDSSWENFGKILGANKSLKSLTLDFRHDYENETFFCHLNANTSIERLTMNRIHTFGNKSLQNIAKLKFLRDLTLNDIILWESGWLMSLSRAPELQVLEIVNCKFNKDITINNDNLTEYFPSLVSLEIKANELTGQQAIEISKWLANIAIAQNRKLNSVSFDCNKITTADAQAIVQILLKGNKAARIVTIYEKVFT